MLNLTLIHNEQDLFDYQIESHQKVIKSIARKLGDFEDIYNHCFDLTNSIQEEIKYIESLFPREAIYSSKTQIIIEQTRDVMDVAFAPLISFSGRNIEHKLNLSLLYYKTCFTYFKKAWQLESHWPNIFYPLLLDHELLNAGFSTEKSKYSNVDAAIAEIIYNNNNNLSSLDTKILDEILKNYQSNSQRYWNIQINFNHLNNKSLNLIYLFVELLNQFEGVRVHLTNVNSGSLKSRIKAYFKDGKAEDDAKEGLEDLKKYAKGKLTKDYAEIKRINQEKKKLKSEIYQIKSEIAEKNQKTYKRKIELDIEKMELENEKLKLENEKLEIENFTAKIKIMKELLKDSLIDQNQFEIIVNDKIYLSSSQLSKSEEE